MSGLVTNGGSSLARELWQVSMKRREFIAFVGWTRAWVSRGPRPRTATGDRFLNGFGPGPFTDVAMTAFFLGLKDGGFVEGRNMSIEFRHADGHYDRLPSLAAELVGRNVAVIFAGMSHRHLLRRRPPKPFL
jgi:putative tryptophan/tyrosine transport system substrate-binding protein